MCIRSCVMNFMHLVDTGGNSVLLRPTRLATLPDTRAAASDRIAADVFQPGQLELLFEGCSQFGPGSACYDILLVQFSDSS